MSPSKPTKLATATLERSLNSLRRRISSLEDKFDQLVDIVFALEDRSQTTAVAESDAPRQSLGSKPGATPSMESAFGGEPDEDNLSQLADLKSLLKRVESKR